MLAQFIKLNYHRIKYQLTRKLSLTPVSFISLSSRRCHGDVVRDDGNEPPSPCPSPWPLCLHPLLNDDVPYWRQVMPPTVFCEFRALIEIASFTPLSNHLDSVVKISVFSNSTEYPGCSRWMCFATSEEVELGLWCSLNLDFRDLFVSPTYIASHSSHLILHIQVLPLSLCSLDPWISPVIVVVY